MNQKTRYLLLFLGIVVAICTIWYYSYSSQKNGATENTNSHSSMYYYDKSDFFKESVNSFLNTKPLSPTPIIFIVNQHTLASHIIAKQFALSANPKIKTVVLITQNNWDAGLSSIITSRYAWKTQFGTILPAKNIIDSLIEKNITHNEESIFKYEHGITGIVPYISHFFPNAKIAPIVIRDSASNEIVDTLANELSKMDMEETTIIGSIDMSHYLPKYIADLHDHMTIQSIKTFDYETLPRLDIDTAPTLRTILKVAENAGHKSFIQTGGINSADIVGNPELMETTGYISGYFKEDNIGEIEESIHTLFVGDIMLDRGVRRHAEKYGINSLFGKVERLFLGTHAVIGNLEGSVTNEQSISQKDNSILRFTFDPKFANLLSRLHFSALSLANNHSFDFGRDGYEQTKDNLERVGITYFGSPQNDISLTTKIILRNKTFCLIGYHDLFTPNTTAIIKEIKNIRESCSYITVFAHWGVEYIKSPSERQRNIAREFIDTGADLIIGTHPHVIQPIEIYKNKAIFYSLGNFMFDQDFSLATRQGLAVHVEWNDEQTQFTLVPVLMNRAELQIAEPLDRQKILSLLIEKNVSLSVASDILEKRKFILWNNKQNNQ